MSELAKQLIAEAKRTRATKLDLSWTGMMEVPEELWELVWLEELVLDTYKHNTKNKGAANQLADIPPETNQLRALKLLRITGDNNRKIAVADLSPLAGLASLQELNIADTKVADLSPLAGLASLQLLNVHSTQVNDLSPLAGIASLQSLNVYDTQVADLSPLAGLASLQSLIVSETQVADLSPLAGLASLQSLSVSVTQVADLSPLAGLGSLQSLYVSETQVTDLSPLAGLASLQSLHVYNTQVADLLPLSGLASLKMIDIEHTLVADLSPLKSLIENGIPVKLEYEPEDGIYVQYCPLDKALFAAIKQGNEAVLAYLNKPKERLFEARVMLLGEPRAGKTSLRRKLKSTNALMPTSQESTKGIEIEIDTCKCKLDKDGESHRMQYNLWDFGGQDMYRLLHQLFVAEQSVYVIVTDTDRNKNEEELDFWLETIQRLGKDKNGNYGPVILLQNPKTDREGSDFTDLKKRYPFWKQGEQFVINLNKLKTGEKEFSKKELERFKHFKGYLEERFHDLDHVGKEMPRQWVRIRKDLVKRIPENHISFEEFRAICKKHGIVKSSDQDDLAGVFHILGFLLHYSNTDLKGMVILNKEWVTDALYRVLDDKIVRDNKGWFYKTDTEKIWHEPKYKDRTTELLGLMQEFKLCYYNEVSKKYIVPTKLSEDQACLPEWDTANNVRLHLQYDWMPRAIATQLIVSLHDFIQPLEKGEQWIWRKGAVLTGEPLQYKDALVRIEDNWRDKRIEIYGKGESTEYLIREVMKKWRELHEPYEDKLEVSKQILCACDKCQSLNRPTLFEYEDVLNARNEGKSLHCNKSFKGFSAEDVLKGIFDELTVSVDSWVNRKEPFPHLGRKGNFLLMKNLIENGQVEETLKSLPQSKETSLLLAQLAELRKQQRGRLIEEKDAELTLNRIMAAAIELLPGDFN